MPARVTHQRRGRRTPQPEGRAFGLRVCEVGARPGLSSRPLSSRPGLPGPGLDARSARGPRSQRPGPRPRRLLEGRRGHPAAASPDPSLGPPQTDPGRQGLPPPLSGDESVEDETHTFTFLIVGASFPARAGGRSGREGRGLPQGPGPSRAAGLVPGPLRRAAPDAGFAARGTSAGGEWGGRATSSSPERPVLRRSPGGGIHALPCLAWPQFPRLQTSRQTPSFHTPSVGRRWSRQRPERSFSGLRQGARSCPPALWLRLQLGLAVFTTSASEAPAPRPAPDPRGPRRAQQSRKPEDLGRPGVPHPCVFLSRWGN